MTGPKRQELEEEKDEYRLVASVGTGILILLGLAQQVLDRLYLNDKQALLILAAMVVGSL